MTDPGDAGIKRAIGEIGQLFGQGDLRQRGLGKSGTVDIGDGLGEGDGTEVGALIESLGINRSHGAGNRQAGDACIAGGSLGFDRSDIYAVDPGRNGQSGSLAVVFYDGQHAAVFINDVIRLRGRDKVAHRAQRGGVRAGVANPGDAGIERARGKISQLFGQGDLRQRGLGKSGTVDIGDGLGEGDGTEVGALIESLGINRSHGAGNRQAGDACIAGGSLGFDRSDIYAVDPGRNGQSGSLAVVFYDGQHAAVFINDVIRLRGRDKVAHRAQRGGVRAGVANPGDAGIERARGKISQLFGQGNLCQSGLGKSGTVDIGDGLGKGDRTEVGALIESLGINRSHGAGDRQAGDACIAGSDAVADCRDVYAVNLGRNGQGRGAAQIGNDLDRLIG